MRKFGLIGYPLSHSFSKKYFSAKFEIEGIKDCSYELYPIEKIKELPLLLQQQQLEGLNVTIPYKKEVLPFLTEVSAEVRMIQACNCVLISGENRIGYNTDTIGFEKTFAPLLQADHKKALVLGTGGASLAVCYTLQKLGIDFLMVSRNPNDRPDQITYTDLNKEILGKFSIIINTTPVGTYPLVNDCPDIPYQFLTGRHYLYDLVYNPAVTLFLQKGKERGAVIQNGAEMLVIQAEESWKIWNGSAR